MCSFATKTCLQTYNSNAPEASAKQRLRNTEHTSFVYIGNTVKILWLDQHRCGVGESLFPWTVLGGLWFNPLVVPAVFVVLVGAQSSLKLQSLTCDSHTVVQVLITHHVAIC